MDGVYFFRFSSDCGRKNILDGWSLKIISYFFPSRLSSIMSTITIRHLNIPKVINGTSIKGTKVCRQANANWEEEFEERKDPKGRTYYWLTGKFVNYDKGTDTDEWALSNHYVSVVPVQFDVTAHHSISKLNKIISDE